MKRFTGIFILLLIVSTNFSQSNQKSASEKLYKIHKRVVDYEKSIGKNPVFYEKLDSFKIELDKYTDNYGHDEVYHNIAVYWGQQYASINPHNSIDFLKQNIAYAKRDRNKYAIAVNQHELGKIYFNQKKIKNAITSYLQTSQMFKELEDWPAYAYSIIDIANVYFYKGQYQEASSYYDKAFHIFKDKLDKEGFYYGAALCYVNQGLINEFQDDYESALENYRIALNYKKKNKNENKYSSVYQYIANVFESLNKNDSAIFYYNLAVESDEKHQLIDELFYSYLGFADFYLRNEDFIQSKEFYKKAYYLSLKHKQIFMLANITGSLGEFFLKLEEIDSAIYYYKESYDISVRNNMMLENKKACDALYNIYGQLGNIDSQFEFLQRLFEIESLDNTDNIAKMQVRFEFDEKIKERELNKLKSQRQSIYIIGISVVALLLASIASMFLRQRFKLKRINAQLEEKHIQIENQAKNLELVNIELKKLDEFKEGLTGIIVHDLKNPINSILHLTELMDKKDETYILIKQTAKQVLNLVYNILDIQKYENLEIRLELSECRIKEIADASIKQERYLSDEKNIKIENNIPVNLFLNGDSEKLLRVYENLITNAIKFTPNYGSITIGYNNDDEYFFVKDTGIGIDKKFQGEIFNKFSQVIAKKSGKALPTGLGLTYCKLAIEAHGGKIWVESEVDEGSTFYFTLPKS
ncbi:ATP-binding protein [Bacteroidota bacterium]